jgi:type IV secretion system protein VirB1
MFDFLALSLLCAPNVHPDTMHRLVQVESSFNPFAIGVVNAHLPHQPRSLEEAVANARWLDSHGYNYSVGLVQRNKKNFPALGLDHSTAFDPCRNLHAGSRLLTQCYRRALMRTPEAQRALRSAFSCYESGNFVTGYNDGYVLKLVAPGTGWRQFGPHDNASPPNTATWKKSIQFRSALQPPPASDSVSPPLLRVHLR